MVKLVLDLRRIISGPKTQPLTGNFDSPTKFAAGGALIEGGDIHVNQ